MGRTSVTASAKLCLFVGTHLDQRVDSGLNTLRYIEELGSAAVIEPRGKKGSYQGGDREDGGQEVIHRRFSGEGIVFTLQ